VKKIPVRKKKDNPLQLRNKKATLLGVVLVTGIICYMSSSAVHLIL
jgi:hypothetical protein